MYSESGAEVVELRREDFKVLEKDMVYLDSACMSLKPEQVVDKVNEYYREYPGCSGRSGHSISRRADRELEDARNKVADFIGASSEDLMFTSGTTESINTVARGMDPDRVFLTEKEHNSNRVIWDRLGVETVEMEGINFGLLEEGLEPGDFVSMCHVSNLDGEALDVSRACEIAKKNHAYSLVDAAQSIPHRPFSAKDIGADFVAFSGHKMLGPTGTGALYVSDEGREVLEPLKYGGGAVKDASYGDSEMKKFPQGFEPGLKNLAGFVGFGAAVDYLESIGMEKIRRHEEKLTEMMVERLESMGLKVLNRGPGIVSIVTESVSPNEAAEILDRRGVKVRSGQHCVHPWFENKEFDSTLRASMHLYNSEEDVERFLGVMEKISKL